MDLDRKWANAEHIRLGLEAEVQQLRRQVKEQGEQEMEHQQDLQEMRQSYRTQIASLMSQLEK